MLSSPTTPEKIFSEGIELGKGNPSRKHFQEERCLYLNEPSTLRYRRLTHQRRASLLVGAQPKWLDPCKLTDSFHSLTSFFLLPCMTVSGTRPYLDSQCNMGLFLPIRQLGKPNEKGRDVVAPCHRYNWWTWSSKKIWRSVIASVTM